MKLLPSLIVFIVLLFTACEQGAAPGGEISMQELKQQMAENKDLLLIDVRTPAEFESGRIPGAKSVPLQGIEDAIGKAVPDKETYFVIYCRTGRRSTVAAGILEKMGYKNFRNYKGSFKEWAAEGNPVEK